MVAASGKDFVFYCSFGERCALAVQPARDVGFKDARHIRGCVDAWGKENGPLGIPV
jgi:rhodanese-related sulfurtransferase